MELIIGGAYQGKLSYARQKYGFLPEVIFTCEAGEIDFSFPCIDQLEQFTYHCAQNDIDPVAVFQENRAQWEKSILICRDLFCGVVPTDPTARRWRENTGRLCQYLAREAEHVVRIFCGLETVLK